jgi:hypothetical protein
MYMFPILNRVHYPHDVNRIQFIDYLIVNKPFYCIHLESAKVPFIFLFAYGKFNTIKPGYKSFWTKLKSNLQYYF